MQPNKLKDAAGLFIRRWGEMGAGWGVSRTLAEIHALLYLSTEPLCTDDVMDQLAVSRGSASTNLRELVNWGLIRRIHQRGDRKEYFEAEKNVWAMFETITRERRRREVQPIVETIEKCLSLIGGAESSRAGSGHELAESYRKRLLEMREFFDLMNGCFNYLVLAGKDTLATMMKQAQRS